MTDGILYSSNGSAVIEVGANNTNARITNSLTINNAKNLQFQTVNTSAYAYFSQQNDDNFVFYTTNTAYGARAVWSIFANSITSNMNFSVPANFSSNVGFATSAALYANGGPGSAGQVLTSNGTTVYWSTSSGSFSNGTTYTWSATQTFQANVAFSGNNISLVTNTGSVLFNAAADANWRIGRNTGSTTKFYYSNNTLDILAAASNLEGVVIGQPGGNTYLETGYAGTFTRNPIFVGNASVNVSINSTAFTGTSNNSTYLNNQLASYYTNATNITTGTLPYAQIPANIINTSSNFTLSGIITHNANIAIVGNATSVFTVSTVNATSNGIFIGNNVIQVGNTSVYANLTPAALFIGGNSVANSTGANNAFNLGGTAAASYQLNSTLAGNVALLTANNANSLGGVLAANYVNTSGAYTISGVHTHSANVIVNATLGVNSVIALNGSNGSAGQVLTSNGNSNAYWSTPTASVNTAATYTWSNAHTFSNNVTFNNTITANASVGAAGYVLASNGTGVYWSPTTYVRQTFTGDNVTTSFTVTGGYTPSQLDVYVNGIKMAGADITITSGTAVVFVTAPPSGAVIDVVGAIAGIMNYATVNVNDTYAWTNTHTFSNTITFNGSVLANTVNAASYTVGTSTIANSTGVYTGVVNGSSITVGTSLIGNATGVYHTGTMNATSYTVGSSFVANSTGVYDAIGDLRDIPVNTEAATYQLTANDSGGVVSTTANVTVNGAVLATNQVFSVFNNSGSNITITSGAGATMYLAGTATTGNRTLAQRGLATLLMVASNTFVISGAGLT